jgi:hypothetical protein
MSSDFETVVDALALDLRTNVTGLTDIPEARIHLYYPANPEYLEARAGERHLAIWPAGEAESPASMGTGFHEMNQTYIVTIWEDAGTEGPRRMADEQANKDWLTLHNAVRARFYVTANQTLGGLDNLWYAGVRFHDVASSVRWMVVSLEGSHLVGFT